MSKTVMRSLGLIKPDKIKTVSRSKLFLNEEVDKEATVKRLNRAADEAVSNFKSYDSSGTDSLIVLGALRYEAVRSGIYESLTVEEIVELLSLNLKGSGFEGRSRAEISEALLELLTSYDDIKTYKVFRIAETDLQVRRGMESVRLVWFSRMLFLNSVYAPDRVLNVFNTHYREAQSTIYSPARKLPENYSAFRTSNFLSCVKHVLPHIYEDTKKMKSLLAVEPSISEYAPLIDEDSKYALPTLLAYYKLEDFGSLYSYLTGEESLTHMSHNLVEIIKTAMNHEVGMSMKLPFSMHFEVLKLHLSEHVSLPDSE